MAKLKLEHLLPSMKADFEAVCKAFNVDICEMADTCIATGIYPTRTMWTVFHEISMQKQNDDASEHWLYRAKVGGVSRVLPFVAHDWQSREIYDIADDSHIETLLRRVLVSFANADKFASITNN